MGVMHEAGYVYSIRSTQYHVDFLPHDHEELYIYDA